MKLKPELETGEKNFSPTRRCRKLDAKQSSPEQLCHFETVLCKTSLAVPRWRWSSHRNVFSNSMALVTVALDLLFSVLFALSTRAFEAKFWQTWHVGASHWQIFGRCQHFRQSAPISCTNHLANANKLALREFINEFEPQFALVGAVH